MLCQGLRARPRAGPFRPIGYRLCPPPSGSWEYLFRGRSHGWLGWKPRSPRHRTHSCQTSRFAPPLGLAVPPRSVSGYGHHRGVSSLAILFHHVFQFVVHHTLAKDEARRGLIIKILHIIVVLRILFAAEMM